MPEMVWIRVKRTGNEWEVPAAKAAELVRWYPDDYEAFTPAPAEKAAETPAETKAETKAETPADAPAGDAAEAPAKKKGK